MDKQQIFNIAGIIVKSLRGELSGQEQRELEDWKSSSPEHLRLWEEFSRYSFLESKLVAERLCGKERAFQQFCRRQEELRRRKRLRLVGYSSVAAVVVIALTCVLFIPSFRHTESVPVAQTLQAGESRAVLTFADGRQMVLGSQLQDTLLQHGDATLTATSNRIEYSPSDHTSGEIVYNQLDIPRKGEYCLVLSDGTKVWLNSESQLRYPVAFQRKERRVFLVGEAYFEVVKDSKPFVVSTAMGDVNVLGTAFDVKAYKNEEAVYTTLVTGSVNFKGRESLILEPGEQAVAFVNGKMEKRKVDINEYIGWKNGLYLFRKQNLESIMNDLARWYDVDVFYQTPDLKDIAFTGNLKRYDNINAFMEILVRTGDIKYRIEGNTILLYK